MKRLAPAASLALAAFVALPAKTATATLPAVPAMPLGIDRDLLPFPGKPIHLIGVDADEAGLFGKPDLTTALTTASLSFDALKGEEHRSPLHDILPQPRGEQRTESDPPAPLPPPTIAPPTGDGATPMVAQAAAQGSATPMDERTAHAAASSTPTGGKEQQPRRLYAGLINAEDMAREQRCLAEAVYFEARSEPEEGRAAVAQVVLNRVKSGIYPTSVCGVVYQNRHRKLACQFTFACEGKSLRITEPASWQAAERIARDVYEGRVYLTDVAAATHYHADYVSPRWAAKMKKMDRIGRHIFYSEQRSKVARAS
ncbi:MAG: hypothetical protein ABS59_15210 [Methylobacterium sp. SCN 67-24]|nr:MAG: hypothetical protein ABS59_15210 [Methylobacterium sp. SCN 67-24]